MVTFSCCFFFFQAEDGIRDWSVTGVQTCALPIFFDGSPIVTRGMPGSSTDATPTRPMYVYMMVVGVLVVWSPRYRFSSDELFICPWHAPLIVQLATKIGITFFANETSVGTVTRGGPEGDEQPVEASEASEASERMAEPATTAREERMVRVRFITS